MNLTISSLVLANKAYKSPFLSFHDSSLPRKLTMNNIFANKFTSSFANFYSSKGKASVVSSTFSRFLNSPLVFDKTSSTARTLQSRQYFTSEFNETYYNFTNLTSEFFGGAIEAVSSSSFTGLVDNCTLSYNSALMGGAIYVAGAGIVLEVNHTKFSNNSALTGSDLFLHLKSATINATRFEEPKQGSTRIYIQSATDGVLFNYSTFIGDASKVKRLSTNAKITVQNGCFCDALPFEGDTTTNFVSGSYCILNRTNNANETTGSGNCKICSFTPPTASPTVNTELNKISYIIIGIVAFFFILSILGVILGSIRAKRLPDNQKLLEKSSDEENELDNQHDQENPPPSPSKAGDKPAAAPAQQPAKPAEQPAAQPAAEPAPK